MREEYRGIDYFRFISALLVIAIHTSPLTSYSAYADFILTRIIARVAVPFFLMTTGFFLFQNQETVFGKVKNFTKRIVVLYCISVLLYLPINLYMGDLQRKNTVKKLLTDFLFQGTMYHLWYFPAVILGVWIVYVLFRKVGKRGTFIVVGILYFIGLFGDSYYGVIEGNVLWENLYGVIFQNFGYTRNGLFYVPVFLVLGAWLSQEKCREKWKTAAGLGISFACMITEGILLHTYHLQRHDSMYIFLIPCMVYLFRLLLLWKGKRNKDLGKISLCIYIIHPLVIVGVRGVAKILHWEKILIQNSIVNFIAVAVISVAMAVCITYRKRADR